MVYFCNSLISSRSRDGHSDFSGSAPFLTGDAIFLGGPTTRFGDATRLVNLGVGCLVGGLLGRLGAVNLGVGCLVGGLLGRLGAVNLGVGNLVGGLLGLLGATNRGVNAFLNNCFNDLYCLVGGLLGLFGATNLAT
jgi:hypothetical protein